jgi:hypothetical protein
MKAHNTGIRKWGTFKKEECHSLKEEDLIQQFLTM